MSDYEDSSDLQWRVWSFFKFQSLAYHRPLTNSNISSLEASWNFESSVRIQEALQTCRELNSCSVRFLFFRKLQLRLLLAPQGCPIQLTHDVSFSFHDFYGSVCCFYLLQHQKNQHFKLIRPSSQDGMFVGKASQVINLTHKNTANKFATRNPRHPLLYSATAATEWDHWQKECEGFQWNISDPWVVSVSCGFNCCALWRLSL